MSDQRDIFNAILRTDFLAFAGRAFQELEGGAAFLTNWHLEAIAWALEGIRSKGERRLVVTMPPRSLKSFLISIAWVAWKLGRDPSLRIICASYSGEFSESLARKCLRLMKAGWYRELFPGLILVRTAAHDIETSMGGGRLATSVGGAVTGLGGDLIIIDDPIKASDAQTPSGRNTVIDWFTTTMGSRLDDKTKGAIVLVMQRLHENDLAGHVLRAGWPELRLAAIAQEHERIQLSATRFRIRNPGDLLHPAREPIHVLEEMKLALGAHHFEAQYLENPLPAQGNLVKAEWIRRYGATPRFQPGDRIVQSWDTANKDGIGNDYSVCITALIRGNTVYILDIYRARISFPTLCKDVVRLARQWNPIGLLVEDAASGQQLIQELGTKQPQGVPTPHRIRPVESKLVRMDGQTPRISAGDLVLPEDAPWLGVFEHELLGFPNSSYDDQVDALSQLLGWLRRLRSDGPGGMPIAGDMMPAIYDGQGDDEEIMRGIWGDPSDHLPDDDW